MTEHWFIGEPVLRAFTRIGAICEQLLDQDQGRFILWTPVWLAIGIGWYFSLKFEPALWPILLIAIVVTIFVIALWHYHQQLPGNLAIWRRLLFGFSLVLLLVLSGFALAKMRSLSVAAPMVQAETDAVMVEGRLRAVEFQDPGIRLLIDVGAIEGFAESDLPKRVRVTWRGQYGAMEPGMTIRMRTVLLPLPEPVAPGAYDFARQLYFDGIGGVGYGVGQPSVRRQNNMWGDTVEKLRSKLAQRIRITAASRPDASAIAAALVTGKRTEIPESAQEALRDAGLAHLLAISGLHMGLIAGFVFFALRGLFVMLPNLALRFPVKKWAAVSALLAALFYLVLSGSAWSAQRAFIMSALVFLAIIFDRRAISLRLVAVAATIILIITPEALFQAGFQMSFAAVTVLIACYERIDSLRHAGAQERNSLVWKIAAFAGGIGLTSFLAGLATGPLAMYHFNRIAVYGLAGNLLAMPLVTLLVMPVAVIGLILYPLGLDAWAWQVMAWGIDQVLRISIWVSGLEGAVRHVPSLSFSSLMCLVGGGLILAIHKSAFKWVGVPVMLLATIGFFRAPVDVYLSDGMGNAAFRVEDDSTPVLMLYSRRKDRFSAENWLRIAGLNPVIKQAPRIGEKGGPVPVCDERSGCSIELASGINIALLEQATQLGAACVASNRLIISLVPIAERQRLGCTLPIYDSEDAQANGAASFETIGNELILKTNKAERGNRPWIVVR